MIISLAKKMLIFVFQFLYEDFTFFPTDRGVESSGL